MTGIVTGLAVALFYGLMAAYFHWGFKRMPL